MKVLVMMIVLVGCANERDISGPCTDCTIGVHPLGWVDPRSANFHGLELQHRDWNFTICARCHGVDYKGGTSGVSCLQCHAEGPTACTTCHGPTGPTTNAHPMHQQRGIKCAQCHIVPATWDTDGHILHDGVAITAPAKVTFGALAATTLDAADRAGPPTWDGTTCSNVYCHGDVFHAAGGTATKLRWDDPTPIGSCDRCHGHPPPNHAQTQCAICHPATAPHVDGIVQVGRTTGCDGCHGSASSPAPPTDLAGNTFTTSIGVGAHQAHLQAKSRISAPIACTTCHVVPATVDAPGHIDSPPPAEVASAVGWDRASATCTASCHGPSRPIWTATGQIFCGSCHGIPPNDASHDATMTLSTCATCHPNTVDPFGNIIVVNGASRHINGIVDSP